MADFINTIDALGDGAVFDSIIDRTITEFADDKITEIREAAFRGCTALKECNLPNAITLKAQCFNNTPALETLHIPKAATLEGYLFQNTPHPYALKEIVCPNCRSFGNQSILHTAITALDVHVVTEFAVSSLPDTLATLILRSESDVSALRYSMSNCSPYIYVPSALIDSYKTAANWSTYANQFRKLEEWTVDGTVTGAFDANRHMVRFFDEDGTFLSYVIVPTGGTATYTGDEPVKEGDWAFKGWNPEPTNVTADMDCYAQFKSTAIVSRRLVERKLSGDYVNDRVTVIGAGAFYDNDLVTAKFPAATTVKNYAFANCVFLNTVDLPVATTLEGQPFSSTGSLATLILRNTSSVATVGGYAFENSNIAKGAGYIYVPRVLVDEYKNATNWSKFASQIRAIEDYPEICGGD